MNNIKNAFNNGKALIGFIMAGDPDLETTQNVIIEMNKAGADIIELGIPFSDPIAESDIVQSANLRALKVQTHLNKIFEMVLKLREQTQIPIVFHTYMNPIFDFEYEKFFKNCNEAGISGLIIPDLPFEEKGEIIDYAKKYNVDIISFVVPSNKERMEKIAKEAEGFIYFVPSISSTGTTKESQQELERDINIIKSSTNLPVALGFSISTEEQAKYFSQKADGIIVGNRFVELIAKYGKQAPAHIYEYTKKMKEAIKNL